MSTADSIAQFRLWQLISPALPIGGYAYSQGLEYAVESGWVRNEQDMQQWISGMLRHMHQQLDLPVLVRIYRAWCADDVATVQYWNDYLLAARETSELLQEDCQLGRALAVLLRDLECKNLAVLNKDELSLATALAAAGAELGDSCQHAGAGLSLDLGRKPDRSCDQTDPAGPDCWAENFVRDIRTCSRMWSHRRWKLMTTISASLRWRWPLPARATKPSTPEFFVHKTTNKFRLR